MTNFAWNVLDYINSFRSDMDWIADTQWTCAQDLLERLKKESFTQEEINRIEEILNR